MILEELIDGLILTVVGMALVLVLLFVINLLIRAMGKVLSGNDGNKPAIAPQNAISAPVTAFSGDDGEVIAAITAALSLCMQGSFRINSVSELHVKPFARSGGPSAWASAARSENTTK